MSALRYFASRALQREKIGRAIYRCTDMIKMGRRRTDIFIGDN
jgi:hypothetical protein